MFQLGGIAVSDTPLLTSCRILDTHSASSLDTRKRTGLVQVPKPTLPPQVSGYFPKLPKLLSFGLSQRKITGATAAAPAIANVFGSVTPAMYRASAAARNDRAHEAATAFACSIFCSPF
jgi:hypothetical protein